MTGRFLNDILSIVRNFLIGVSLFGLIGAGGAVTWSVLSRPEDVYITREVTNSFNLQNGPTPSRAPLPLARGETLRDAVAAAPPAASSLTRPIATDGMAYGAMKAPPPEAPRKFTVITAKALDWMRRSPLVSGLAARPAAFLLSHSALGSASGLRSFLADPKKVDGYMNSALVRITINSPAAAKALLGNPAVVRAFLNTPAMRDSKTVSALLASPMLAKMLDCPAIQQALSDPVVLQKMMSDTQTVVWIAAHPQALAAIADVAPALGEAFTSKSR